MGGSKIAVGELAGYKLFLRQGDDDSYHLVVEQTSTGADDIALKSVDKNQFQVVLESRQNQLIASLPFDLRSIEGRAIDKISLHFLDGKEIEIGGPQGAAFETNVAVDVTASQKNDRFDVQGDNITIRDSGGIATFARVLGDHIDLNLTKSRAHFETVQVDHFTLQTRGSSLKGALAGSHHEYVLTGSRVDNLDLIAVDSENFQGATIVNATDGSRSWSNYTEFTTLLAQSQSNQSSSLVSSKTGTSDTLEQDIQQLSSTEQKDFEDILSTLRRTNLKTDFKAVAESMNRTVKTIKSKLLNDSRYSAIYRSLVLELGRPFTGIIQDAWTPLADKAGYIVQWPAVTIAVQGGDIVDTLFAKRSGKRVVDVSTEFPRIMQKVTEMYGITKLAPITIFSVNEPGWEDYSARFRDKNTFTYNEATLGLFAAIVAELPHIIWARYVAEEKIHVAPAKHPSWSDLGWGLIQGPEQVNELLSDAFALQFFPEVEAQRLQDLGRYFFAAPLNLPPTYHLTLGFFNQLYPPIETAVQNISLDYERVQREYRRRFDETLAFMKKPKVLAFPEAPPD